MGKMIYRMCLFLVLVVAVAGGIYYYATFQRIEEEPEQGTFVRWFGEDEPEAELEEAV